MRKLLFVLLLYPLLLNAQLVNESYYPDRTSDSLVTSGYRALVFSNHFLKNNEYFNPFNEGITYIGSQVQPEFTVVFGRKAILSTGWVWRYFYGSEKFDMSLPVIRFDYHAMTNLWITMGRLHGNLEHELIEPIYNPDNYFIKNPENGLQIRHSGQKSAADLWMDWEHFLYPGDDRQEQITGGCNLRYSESFRNISATLNLQGVIHHYGGQVVASDAPLITRANLAPGIIVKAGLPDNYLRIRDISGGFYYIQSIDMSGKPQLPYKKGYAAFSYFLLQASALKAMIAWFHGEYFFAPLGEHLFQSVSALNDWYHRDNRNLINSKLIFEKALLKGVKAGIRFESYYDVDLGNFDFCYGLNVRADARLFGR